METQLLVLFSVGTLLVLNGLLGRTSLLDAESADEPVAVLEPSDAPEGDDTNASDADAAAVSNSRSGDVPEAA